MKDISILYLFSFIPIRSFMIEQQPIYMNTFISDCKSFTPKNERDRINDFSPPPYFLDSLIEALKRYKGVYGHYHVEDNFVIPDERSWPITLRGVRLGQNLELVLRSSWISRKINREPFSDIGFPLRAKDRKFETLLRALTLYRQIYGNISVKSTFKVPTSYNWPSDMWGYPLGNYFRRIILGELYHENKYRSRLQEMNLLHSSVSKSKGYEVTKTALQSFISAYGSISVPQQFMVPNNTSLFPPSTWNVPLGIRVRDVRQGRAYRKYIENDFHIWRSQLQPIRRFGFDDFCDGLTCFLRIYGHLNIQSKFIVPADSHEWPVRLWGWPLGIRVRDVRRGHMHHGEREREKLTALGFVWSTGRVPSREISQAVELYKEIYGTADVPHSFVVPCQSPWPERFWTLKLGLRSFALYLRSSSKLNNTNGLSSSAIPTVSKKPDIQPPLASNSTAITISANHISDAMNCTDEPLVDMLETDRTRGTSRGDGGERGSSHSAVAHCESVMDEALRSFMALDGSLINGGGGRTNNTNVKYRWPDFLAAPSVDQPYRPSSPPPLNDMQVFRLFLPPSPMLS